MFPELALLAAKPLQRRILMWAWMLLLCLPMLGNLPALAQVDSQDDVVELNLAGKVKLSDLVEAISRQLKVRFLYSADLAQRQVTVYTPSRLPRSVLPTLVGSLLKSEGLAIVDSDVPGWKRIIEISKVSPYAPAGEAGEVLQRVGPAGVVTQVIPINNLSITSFSTAAQSFLSTGANIISLPESSIIIVTDYAQKVQRLVELVAAIDRPLEQPVIDFYVPEHRDSRSLVEQARDVINRGSTPTRTRRANQASNEQGASSQVELIDDRAGQRIILAGEKPAVLSAIELLGRLDSGTRQRTRGYRLENITATRFEELIRGIAGESEDDDDRGSSGVQITVDETGNLIIVRGSNDLHQQIEKLLGELDRPVLADESPIRFYKLKNANAIEVLFSLQALQQAVGGVSQTGAVGGFGTLGGLNVGGVTPIGVINPGLGQGLGGLNTGAAGLGIGGQAIGGIQSGALGAGGLFGDTGGQSIPLPFNNGQTDEFQPGSALQNQNAALLGGGLGTFGSQASGLAGGQVASLPGGARVSADVATNSLIVYAPSSVQPLYEKLILSLDQRRPQVMIEADIIAIDTSDNFRLGVEVSIGDRQGASRLFSFTSFGLSEIDPATGALTVNPALGFNGVLIDPDVADTIVQALSSHTRARVLASPKILVNDNQRGSLESVASVPFQSINTINTISSQSLGGSQEAGTIITVTPHINEDDHLQLEFEVEFSTFGAGGTATLPPPRQIDRIGSVVTIPDGQTVVVGGLKRVSESDAFTGVPLLEKIPVIRELSSLTTEGTETTSFFLFIRPKILRDSRFRDLQYLSDVEANLARLPGDEPESQPILMPCPKLPDSQPEYPFLQEHRHDAAVSTQSPLWATP
ncbi:MAG: secretin N-terminal domain-containing protein [Planctomycetota bacterium]